MNHPAVKNFIQEVLYKPSFQSVIRQIEEIDEKTNHFYDDIYPYSLHTNAVAKLALRFFYDIEHFIVKEKYYFNGATHSFTTASFIEELYLIAKTHDTLEDSNLTYNDLKKMLGAYVADHSFALQNEKGKTRSERASDKYYNDMKKYPIAQYIKCCDRLANLTYSFAFSTIKKDGDMFKTYVEENKNFLEKVEAHKFPLIYSELKRFENICS